ncbi:MAG: hypothetical protein U5N55_06860 [Cypionkella sp.]|nr:hypothetical protein [Cypionkella sp.]
MGMGAAALRLSCDIRWQAGPAAESAGVNVQLLLVKRRLMRLTKLGSDRAYVGGKGRLPEIDLAPLKDQITQHGKWPANAHRHAVIYHRIPPIGSQSL